MRHFIVQTHSVWSLFLRNTPLYRPQVGQGFPTAATYVHLFHKSLRWSSRYAYPSTTYHISAAYSAKDRPLRPGENLFTFDPHSKAAYPPVKDEAAARDKGSQRSDSGQDAFFVSPVGSSKSIAFGVVRHMN